MTKTFISRHTIKIETLLVFLLAASVRLTHLSVFRVVDEEDRWAWGIDFFQALLAGDLPATLIGDGYPGIFPAWLESIWLFLAALYRSVLQGSWIGDDGIYLLLHEWGRWSNLAYQRFPIVLINTLLVVAVFLYVRHLFDRKVALVAAILISLDPFYLSDSRVNRAEALVSGLMTLSFLALVVAAKKSDWRQFIFSGIVGGLAWLTKSQALVLIPMFGAIGLIWYWQKDRNLLQAVFRTAKVMVIWVIIASITFIVLWPAAWTIPEATFDLMSRFITRKVGEEGVKIFFLGRTVLDEDPGYIFYPVIFLLRVTPLVLLSLIASFVLVARQQWQSSAGFDWRTRLDKQGVWTVILFALLYVGGMSLGSHKHGRFLMPAFPTIHIVAAVGMVMLMHRFGWLAQRMWLGVIGILLIQLVTVLPYHPYYYTFYNPLMGGGQAAMRLTRVGWGEGMNEVADYLNTLDDPESLTVSTRFHQYLLGYPGKTINLDSRGRWVQADKIIFYVQQAQRMLDPSPGVIRYFQTHIPPEKIITIDGIDYAWVYPNPIEYPANPEIDQVDNQLALFGYRWQMGGADPPEAQAELVWENLSGLDPTVGIRLWGHSENVSDWYVCHTKTGFESAAKQIGDVVESSCPLPNNELTAGLYSLQIGIQETNQAWNTLDFAAGWSAIEVQTNGQIKRVSPNTAFARLADEAVPSAATRLARAFDYTVYLLAYELTPKTPTPGQPLTLTLYWQNTEPRKQDVDVSIQGFIGDERIVLLNGPPVGGERPTSSWQPGEVIQDTWVIPLPEDLAAPAQLRLDVNLFRPDILRPLQVRNLEGVDIPGAITQVRIVPNVWPTYEGTQPLNFTFDDAIKLIGQQQTQSTDGATLDIHLYWQSLQAFEQDQMTFIHLLKPDGTMATQSDVPPAHGRYPVSAWQENDIVLSYHTLSIPPDLPAGAYRLVAGLYHPTNWTRLPAQDANGQSMPDQAVPIGELVIP
ncbi:MAG: glycosyltransferase family 39 protein [Chloroflexota bacterium]